MNHLSKACALNTLALKMALKILILLIISMIMLVNAKKNYQDYKVFSIIPTTEGQVNILKNLRENKNYIFWSDVVNVDSDVRIMVAPKNVQEFMAHTKKAGFEPTLKIENVQQLIDEQLKPAQNVTRTTLGSLSWNQYHTLEEIYSWLDDLQTLYPDVVTTVTIGTSNEGRPIKGVVINFNPENRRYNPLIGMLEGGIHSREWISPPTVTWIIKEFLTSQNPEVRFLAEAFIWHMFPVTNPDGYSYSFTDDRMWRKNRNTAHFVNCTGDDDLSNGIDLNRNFDFLWMSIGASQDPCAEDYAGPSPVSEPETVAISNYVLQLKQQGTFIYYFSFHSAAQMILIPYSHSSGYEVLESGNYADMYEIAIRGAEKLKEKHGTVYTVGTSHEILYPVSGSSFDWAKGIAEIPISLLFELRGRPAGHGFLLPPEQIIPNNEEILECILEMDRTARKMRYYSSDARSIIGSMLYLVVSLAFLILYYHSRF